jgi:hypothetical protein
LELNVYGTLRRQDLNPGLFAVSALFNDKDCLKTIWHYNTHLISVSIEFGLLMMSPLILRTRGNILLRGTISSEPGQLEQLKVQRTTILSCSFDSLCLRQ